MLQNTPLTGAHVEPTALNHRASAQSIEGVSLPQSLFNPIELAAQIGQKVMQGNKRKYLRFGTTPDYRTGIATGYTVGCNLRCVFCWGHETRDNPSLANQYFSPTEAFDQLCQTAATQKGVDKIRISDAEPTIGFDHLLELIELTQKSNLDLFVLETNGILTGNQPSMIRQLAQFSKLYVRVSLKAGNPLAFSRKTGAMPEFFELPFATISYLHENNMCFGVSAMSADPRFMDPIERIQLIARLAQIDPSLVLRLEEEMIILFPTTRKRLQKAGWDCRWKKNKLLRFLPWASYIQWPWYPIATLARQKPSLRYTLKNIKQLSHGI